MWYRIERRWLGGLPFSKQLAPKPPLVPVGLPHVSSEKCANVKMGHGTLIRLNVSRPIETETLPTTRQLAHGEPIPTAAHALTRLFDKPGALKALTGAIQAGARLFDIHARGAERQEGGARLLGNAVRKAVQQGSLKHAGEVQVTSQVTLRDDTPEDTEPGVKATSRRGRDTMREPDLAGPALDELRQQADDIGVPSFAAVVVHQPRHRHRHPTRAERRGLVDALQRLAASPLVKAVTLGGVHGWDLGGYAQVQWGGALSQLKRDRYAHPRRVAALLGPLEQAGLRPASLPVSVGLFMDPWAWYGLSVEEPPPHPAAHRGPSPKPCPERPTPIDGGSP